MSKTFAPWAADDRQGAHTLRSGDGVLTVTLQRSANGIYVQRIVQRACAGRATQASVLQDRASLRRWCDADSARFESPLIHAGMLRAAAELSPEHDAAEVPG